MRFVKHAAIAVSLLSCSFIFGQEGSVGINTTNPNPNTVLELVSPNDNQGFLVPRLTTGQRVSMANSLDRNDHGLMVFDNDLNRFYWWN